MNQHVAAARAAVFLLPDECSAAWRRADASWRRIICQAAKVPEKVAEKQYEEMNPETRVKIAEKLRALARTVAPILRGLQ